MNPDPAQINSINAIVRCAFKICLIYFLRCFLPSVSICSYIRMSTDYDKELHDQILVMRRIIGENKNSNVNSVNNMINIPDKSVKTAEGFTKTVNYDNSIKDSAFKEIRQSITNQLKDKYGENICIDFTYDDEKLKENKENKEKKEIYALKIREIGRGIPEVDVDSKQFYVKSRSTFNVYPLTKRSMVKCEHID